MNLLFRFYSPSRKTMAMFCFVIAALLIAVPPARAKEEPQLKLLSDLFVSARLLQYNYGVFTVLYATSTHQFDGLAVDTHGGGGKYYQIDSFSGNKYAGYSLRIPLNSGLQGITAANDDLWRVAA